MAEPLPERWTRTTPAWPENNVEIIAIVDPDDDGNYRLTPDALALLLVRAGFNPVPESHVTEEADR